MVTRYRASWHYEDLNEFTLVYVTRWTAKKDGKRYASPFKTRPDADKRAKELKAQGNTNISVTQDTLRGNIKFKSDGGPDIKGMQKEMKKDDAYAIGMAQAKKSMNDEPPLEKDTIKKGHKIAKAIMKEAMSPEQIKKLKNSWADIKLMSPEKVKTLKNFLDKYSTDTLMQLAQSNINFVSNMARSVAMRRKAADPKHAGSHKTHSMKETISSDDDYRAKKKALQDIQSDPVKSSIVGRDKLQMRKDKLEKDYQAFKSGGGNKIAAQKEPEKGKKEIKENVHPAKALYEAIAAVKNKAKKTGMPYSILKQVYNRGMAAWKGGHRPGTTPQQWAMARVNSFVTKSSGTWGGADKDLAKKVRGSKD